MNAFRTVLPTASIRCCRFHMGQAMHRKICTSVWHRHKRWCRNWEVVEALLLTFTSTAGRSWRCICWHHGWRSPELTVRSLRWLYAEHLCRSATAAFLQLYWRRHPLLRSYHEQTMAVNLFIHTSVSQFRFVPSSQHLSFFERSSAVPTNAYIQLQNIRSRKLNKKPSCR